MRVSNYIRQHHLGLVAIFIALTGTAYAGNQAADQPGPEAAKSKKSKKSKPGPPGPQGPQGVQGVQGTQGATGAQGSPDTGAQILTKLAPVDGAGSGLDADLLDGLSSADFTRRVGGGFVQATVFLSVPAGTACDEASEVGRLAIFDSGAAAAVLYVCGIDALATPLWSVIS